MEKFHTDKKLVIGMVGLPARGKNWINDLQVQDLEFFDDEHTNVIEQRKMCAEIVLNDVAVYDGTNSTIQRRKDVKRIIEENLPSCQIMWIESICDNEELLKENIKSAKVVNPEYENKDLEEREYINYKGESLFIPEERIGGDPDLSKDGEKYIVQLNKFMKKEFAVYNLADSKQKPLILTSTLLRARRTAAAIELNSKPISLKVLDEINVGIYDSMTFQEVIEKYPETFKDRQADKLRIRFPRGESYMDLVQRVEQVIFEIEKSEQPIIIVAHQAVLRCIYAYFTKYEVEEVPNLDMPLNTVIKLTPATYFCEEKRYKFDLVKESVVEKIVQKPEIIEDFIKNI